MQTFWTCSLFDAPTRPPAASSLTRAEAARNAMPGINVRFQNDERCAECGQVTARADSYATVRTETGAAILFSEDDPPKQLSLWLQCPAGHRSAVPDATTLEWWFATPRDAPKAQCNVIAIL